MLVSSISSLYYSNPVGPLTGFFSVQMVGHPAEERSNILLERSVKFDRRNDEVEAFRSRKKEEKAKNISRKKRRTWFELKDSKGE